MDAAVFHVGIDVSKDRLDGHVHETGERFSFANDTKGIAGLAAQLLALGPRLVGFEAAGAYEVLASAALSQAGLPVVVVNPAQVRRFAKTDAIEAAVIAHFLVATQPEVRPLEDEDTRHLSDLVPAAGRSWR
jgi:transposase